MRRRAKKVPDRGAEQGYRHNRRDEHGGDFVRQLADFRFTALRLAHHADNARQGGLTADGAGGKQYAAVLHYGPGMNGVTVAFLLRHWLAGEHRFIEPGFALANDAVDRYAIAGGQTQDHSRLNLSQRQIFFAFVGDHPR